MFEAEAKKYQVKCSFSKDGYCAGYTFAKSDIFIKQIVSIYKSVGLKTNYYEYSGISDANVLNQHGIKTVNLTDGARFPHSKEEQIELINLNKLCEIIKKCIIEL